MQAVCFRTQTCSCLANRLGYVKGYKLQQHVAVLGHMCRLLWRSDTQPPMELLCLLACHHRTIHGCALQAKTHEKVDSIGEERSIACHAVVMLIHK